MIKRKGGACNGLKKGCLVIFSIARKDDVYEGKGKLN